MAELHDFAGYVTILILISWWCSEAEKFDCLYVKISSYNGKYFHQYSDKELLLKVLPSTSSFVSTYIMVCLFVSYAGNGCKSISYHFRIPCKDLSECKVFEFDNVKESCVYLAFLDLMVNSGSLYSVLLFFFYNYFSFSSF